MKKIVILSETLSGGVRRHLMDFFLTIDTSRFDIYFLYGTERIDSILENKLAYLELKGINLIEINGFNNKIGINDFNVALNLYKKLKNISPDILHCHSSKAGALGRVIGKILGVPIIYYTPHAYIFQNPDMNKLKRNVYIWIEQILSKYTTSKTINVSNGEKEVATKSRLGDQDNFLVIPNGVGDLRLLNQERIDELKREFRITPNDFIVGNIARVDEQKDPFTFIEIARLTLKQNPHIKFIYVGDGSLLDECRKKVKSMSLESKVLFIGFSEETDYLLNIFDVFLTTSKYEGLPYSLIEATRASLPIVATNIVGNNEIVRDEENGFLYSLDNLSQCIHKLDLLINNEILRKTLSINSYNIYKKSYTLDKMMKSYETLYAKNY